MYIYTHTHTLLYECVTRTKGYSILDFRASSFIFVIYFEL